MFRSSEKLLNRIPSTVTYGVLWSTCKEDNFLRLHSNGSSSPFGDDKKFDVLVVGLSQYGMKVIINIPLQASGYSIIFKTKCGKHLTRPLHSALRRISCPFRHLLYPKSQSR